MPHPYESCCLTVHREQAESIVEACLESIGKPLSLEEPPGRALNEWLDSFEIVLLALELEERCSSSLADSILERCSSLEDVYEVLIAIEVSQVE